jgi:predicted RNase H-like HicB family nuclease
MTFKVVLELAQEGGYVVYVPFLPGCISEGDSKEEALKNIKEAIELYLEPNESPVLANNSAKIAEVTV